MDSIKKTARRAGLLYFLIGVTAPIGLEYVPGKLIVAGDAAATAARVAASPSLLRIGIASELFHQTVEVFLVLVIYRLFRAVDERNAVTLVLLGLVPVPIMFLNVVNEIGALLLTGGAGFLTAFSKPQLDAAALLLLQLHNQGIIVASVFWGLWLFPFGILIIRSGFIPKFLGVLLFIAGSGYLASAAVSVLLPRYGHAVGQVAILLEFGEVPIIFWLLIWGARTPRPAQTVAA